MIKKKSCGISLVLVFDLKISNGCNKILQNFQGWSSDLFASSRGTIRNVEMSRLFSKKYVSNKFFYSGITQYFMLPLGRLHENFWYICSIITYHLRISNLLHAWLNWLRGNSLCFGFAISFKLYIELVLLF